MELTGTPAIPVAHDRNQGEPKNNGGCIDIQLANGQALPIPLDTATESVTVSVTLADLHAVVLPDDARMGWL